MHILHHPHMSSFDTLSHARSTSAETETPSDPLYSSPSTDILMLVMSRINIGSDQSHRCDIIAVHSGKQVRVRMWLWLGLSDVTVFPSLQCDQCWTRTDISLLIQEHQHGDIRLSLHQHSQRKVQVRIIKNKNEALYGWARQQSAVH